MLNTRTVKAATPTSVKRGAVGTILQFAVASQTDPVQRRNYARIIAGVRRPISVGSGRYHRLEVRIYDRQSETSNIWGTCDCESWLYRSEVAWSLKGSSSLIYSNGKLPNTRNPHYEPWCCPHMIMVLTKAMSDLKVKDVLEHPPEVEEVVEKPKRKPPPKPKPKKVKAPKKKPKKKKPVKVKKVKKRPKKKTPVVKKTKTTKVKTTKKTKKPKKSTKVKKTKKSRK